MSDATDRSTHPTVVQYAVQTMMRRGASPSAAARSTAKSLSGSENLFLGPGVTIVDAAALEAALWDDLASFAIQAMSKIRPGKEHYALDGTVQHFNQPMSVRRRLKAVVVERLGSNPFVHDDAANRARVTLSTSASEWPGLSRGRSLSSFDQRRLRRGARVEREHVGSATVATRIAADHLTEDPRYYEKLAKMEGNRARGSRRSPRLQEALWRELGERGAEPAAPPAEDEVARLERILSRARSDPFASERTRRQLERDLERARIRRASRNRAVDYGPGITKDELLRQTVPIWEEAYRADPHLTTEASLAVLGREVWVWSSLTARQISKLRRAIYPIALEARG